MWIKTQYVCRLIAYGASVSDVHVRLRAFMQVYEPISIADWALICPRWAPFRAKPATPILREGDVCGHVYFLDAGLARYRYLDAEGVDRTKFFTEPPCVFTAQRSFNAGGPSREAITAVTTCEGSRIGRADTDALLAAVPAFATFVRKLVAEVQGFTEDILAEAQTMTAEERYARMLTERPTLLRDLPLKYLASYLGVAPPQ